MDSTVSSVGPARSLVRFELPAGAGLLGLLLLLSNALVDLSVAFIGLCISLYAVLASLIARSWYPPSDQAGFGWANRVTLARATLTIYLAALVPLEGMLSEHLWTFMGVSLLVLTLDGVDGAVARALGSSTDFGARFDMELDAVFILILCLAVISLEIAGVWVLLIGLMRYGLIVASWRWPWLTHELPASRRRKTICVWQIVTLLIALLPITPRWLASSALLLALALLVYSFAVDTLWLHRKARSVHSGHQNLSSTPSGTDAGPTTNHGD